MVSELNRTLLKTFVYILQLGTDEEGFTMYYLKKSFFTGVAIILVNRNPSKYLKCTLEADDVHEHIYATRPCEQSVDIIPPMCRLVDLAE